MTVDAITVSFVISGHVAGQAIVRMTNTLLRVDVRRP